MFVELYRNDGKFVICYNDDAYVLQKIFGYKIIGEGKNDKLGFPNIVLEKLSTKLANLNINYRIYYKKN